MLLPGKTSCAYNGKFINDDKVGNDKSIKLDIEPKTGYDRYINGRRVFHGDVTTQDENGKIIPSWTEDLAKMNCNVAPELNTDQSAMLGAMDDPMTKNDNTTRGSNRFATEKSNVSPNKVNPSIHGTITTIRGKAPWPSY